MKKKLVFLLLPIFLSMLSTSVDAACNIIGEKITLYEVSQQFTSVGKGASDKHNPKKTPASNSKGITVYWDVTTGLLTFVPRSTSLVVLTYELKCIDDTTVYSGIITSSSTSPASIVIPSITTGTYYIYVYTGGVTYVGAINIQALSN